MPPRPLLLAVILLLVAQVAGCGFSPGRSTLTMTVAGREVKATLDGGGTFSNRLETIILDSAAGKIVVEPTFVTRDGVKIATLPRGTKLIEIDYTAGKLTVSADGKPLVTP